MIFSLVQKRWKDIPCVTRGRGNSLDICFSPTWCANEQSTRQSPGNMKQTISSEETKCREISLFSLYEGQEQVDDSESMSKTD